MKKLILALLLSGIPLCAQTVTTYTGTIKDLTGATVASGRITWQLNSPSGGVIPGTGAFVASTVSCLINASGAPVSSLDGVSACTVVNNTSLTPTGTSYTICIQPYNVTPGSCFVTYATGGTVNISNLVPTPATQPNYGVASTQVANTWASPQTFSQGFTVGSSFSAASLASLGGLSSLLTSLQSFAGPVNIPTLNGLPAQEYKTVSDNPTPLVNHWRYLHASSDYTAAAGIDVIFPNDSLWEGDWVNSQAGPLGCGPNTAVPQYSQNRMAEQIRISLQAQYGYGGTGLRPILNVMGCALVNPELFTASPTALTVSTLIGPQYLTNGSVVQMASGQVITWADQLPYSQIRTYCADNASSNPITVAVDGTAEGTACGAHNGTAIARVATGSTIVSLTTHSATLTCTTGPCFLYGVEGRTNVNSGNSGVRIHNTSVGSAPSAFFSGHTDFEDLIHNGSDVAGSVQLIIYAMGTNDANLSISLGTYQSNTTTYFAHELAKTPETPVIVIYRPGMNSSPSSTYFSWLTGYGLANNMLVIDQTNRWGKTYVPGSWYLGNDNLHFNDGGNLDAAHTILNALTDITREQKINPIFGDTGLNPGVVGVTAPVSATGQSAPGYMWVGVPGIPDHSGWYGIPTGGGTYAGMIGFFNPKTTVPLFRINPATGEIDTTNNILDYSGGVAGNAGFAGVVSANNGLKAGVSGSTITDTRAIMNSVAFCVGGTAACSQSTLQSAKMVAGFTALSAGTITVSNIPAFTSASTFWCSATDVTASTGLKVVPLSATTFSITAPTAVSDTVMYICAGS